MNNKMCDECDHRPVCRFVDEAAELIEKFENKSPFKVFCEQFSTDVTPYLNYPREAIPLTNPTERSRNSVYSVLDGPTCILKGDTLNENEGWACQDAPGL